MASLTDADAPKDDGSATRDDRFAFPQLDPEQIDRARCFGEVKELDSGTILFARGARSVDFYIVLRGRVEIFDDGVCDADGTPQVIHVHHERGFTGELDLFSDRKILVSGRLVTDDGSPGQVLCVPRPSFAKMLSAEPDVGNAVMRAFILRRVGLIDHAQGGVLVVGRRDSGETLRVHRFLRRNGYPMKALELDDPADAEEARGVLEQYGGSEDELPLVLCSNDHTLTKPDNAALAHCLGLTESPDADKIYDVTVVGAGPAGLAAAVYAASEGLSTVVIEGEAPGGQAGTSSRIENYLGFPAGISGQELAGRAMIQAQKFGATLTVPRFARHLEPCDGGRDGYKLHLDHGPPVRTRAVVLAGGAHWRTLDLDNFGQFEGSGIHYAATAVEADLCKDSEVVVVGGGNSAGQAAVFLSGRAKKVYVLVRGEGLADSMSEYLIDRIQASPKIELLTHTEVTALRGDSWLREVTWTNNESGEQNCRNVEHLFLMIGAVPNSDWLDGTLRRDDRGFVLTGGGAAGDGWPLERPPYAQETSLPGVFAVGDVRSGSVKRVASAVGEGSVCISDLHRTLVEQQAAH